MRIYVVGFLFDAPREFVALIKKNRPAWQLGLLNGPGGHVEDGEVPVQAMRRELKEEAGVDITEDRWRLFCILHGAEAKVYCYTSCRNANLQTLTDEPVGWYHVKVAQDPGVCLPSLSWLIPMALDDTNPDLVAIVDNVAR